MKNLIFLLTCCFLILPARAKSTNGSKFAELQYAEKQGFSKVHINVKKEHTDELQQKIGEQKIPAITYGYGDLKVKGCKKCRVAYIVLLDCNCNPIWSYIIPSKQ